MDPQHRKTSLRMIPYGLYVLTAEAPDGRVAASTVNWVTQASFEPPLVAVGVKAETATHELVKLAGTFALNVLGKGQQDLAFAFFKSQERDGNSIGGQTFSPGTSGALVFAEAAPVLECTLAETVERGDHSLFIGEVVGASVQREISGRPDVETLALADLGEKTFYGG